jgi:hypothetical protein
MKQQSNELSAMQETYKNWYEKISKHAAFGSEEKLQKSVRKKL